MKFPIPDDWDGESYCDFAVCWPDSEKWRGLLRGLISLTQRGWTWDERTGSILDIQTIGKAIVEKNLDLRACLMACDNTEIADALNNIAAALQNAGGQPITVNVSSGSCGGCDFTDSQSTVNVQTTVVLGDGSTWQVFGEQPMAELGPGEFPPEYPNLGAYDADKCAKANKIVDDFIASLENFANTNWTVGVIGAAVILGCVVGLITVPAATIPLLLFALTANVGITALLLQFKVLVGDNKQDLVCILAEGDNIVNIIELAADFFDTLIALIPGSGTLAVVIRSIALWLLNADTLGYLFTGNAAEVYPDADCSACATELECFDFEAEQDLLGWVVTDETGGSVDLTIVAQGMQVSTGAVTDSLHTVFSSPSLNYTIQTGDIFYILYTNDPVPYGRTLWMTLDGIRTVVISEGTIVDHLVCAPAPLESFVGQVVTDIEISINRFGGGTWIIRRAGFNCPCTP